VTEFVGVPFVTGGGAGTLEHMAAVLVEGKADAILRRVFFTFSLTRCVM